MRSSFSQALKAARIGQNITLRQFCLNNGLDPGNQSKYERGVIAPPNDPGKIVDWLSWMGYKRSNPVTQNVLRCAMLELEDRIHQGFKPYME